MIAFLIGLAVGIFITSFYHIEKIVSWREGDVSETYVWRMGFRMSNKGTFLNYVQQETDNPDANPKLYLKVFNLTEDNEDDDNRRTG